MLYIKCKSQKIGTLVCLDTFMPMVLVVLLHCSFRMWLTRSELFETFGVKVILIVDRHLYVKNYVCSLANVHKWICVFYFNFVFLDHLYSFELVT